MANLFDILNFTPTSQDTTSEGAHQSERRSFDNDEKKCHDVATSSPVAVTISPPTSSGRPARSPRSTQQERRTSQLSDSASSDTSIHDQAQLLEKAEQLFELDTLKQFTIPKKKKVPTELLENISLDSREYKQEVLPVISLSYKSKNASKSFRYNRVQLVHNDELLKKYLEKRKEMRQDGYIEKEITDSFAFLYCASDQQIMKVVTNGIQVGNLTSSSLGHPEMGVSLTKHADILSPTLFNSNHQGKLIIFKMIKGKVKSVVECQGGSQLEPTPNFDCHVSKSGNCDLMTLTAKQAFDSTQIYLYEYGDLGVEQYPRQIMPYAVVNFTYLGGSKIGSAKLISKSVGLLKSLSPQLAPQTASPTRGRTVEQNGYIVWDGPLTSKTKDMCKVNLVVYGSFLKPARIGDKMSLYTRCALTTAQNKYISGLQTLKCDGETTHDGKYYSYGKLQPQDEQGMFSRFRAFLMKNSLVAVSNLEDDVRLLVMADNNITKYLGLPCSSDQLVLHCIFVSPVSRQQKLSDQTLMDSPYTQQSGFRMSDSAADYKQKLSTESVIALLDASFKNPPRPTRVMDDRDKAAVSRYADGFMKSAPAASLVLGGCIKKAFKDASTLQEQYNIAIARKNAAAKQQSPHGYKSSHQNKTVITKEMLAAQLVASSKKNVLGTLPPPPPPPMLQVSSGTDPSHVDPRLLKRQASLQYTSPAAAVSEKPSTETLQHSLSMPVLTPEVTATYQPLHRQAGLSPVISSPGPELDIQRVKEIERVNQLVIENLSVGMSPTQDSSTGENFVVPEISVTPTEDVLHLTFKPEGGQISDSTASPAKSATAESRNAVDFLTGLVSKNAGTSKSSSMDSVDEYAQASTDDTVVNLLQKYHKRSRKQSRQSGDSSHSESSQNSNVSVPDGDNDKDKTRRKTKRQRLSSGYSATSSHSIELSDSEVDRIVKGGVGALSGTTSSTKDFLPGSENKDKNPQQSVKIQLADLNFFPEPDLSSHKRVRRKSESQSKIVMDSKHRAEKREHEQEPNSSKRSQIQSSKLTTARGETSLNSTDLTDYKKKGKRSTKHGERRRGRHRLELRDPADKRMGFKMDTEEQKKHKIKSWVRKNKDKASEKDSIAALPQSDIASLSFRIPKKKKVPTATLR